MSPTVSIARRVSAFLSGILLLGVGQLASASLIIDFEGVSVGAAGLNDFADVGDYRFTLSGGTSPGFTITNQSNIGVTGDTSLFAVNDTQLTMSRVDGMLFDLISFDLAGSFQGSPNRYASLVTATGNGSTASAVPLDGVYTPVPANFLGVASVSFVPTVNANGGPNNNEFTLDNIAVRIAGDMPVPVPATLALFLLGAAALGRRRRAGH